MPNPKTTALQRREGASGAIINKATTKPWKVRPNCHTHKLPHWVCRICRNTISGL